MTDVTDLTPCGHCGAPAGAHAHDLDGTVQCPDTGRIFQPVEEAA